MTANSLAAVLALAVFSAACSPSAPEPPPSPGARAEPSSSRGFPVVARPLCSAELLAAVHASDVEALSSLIARGTTVKCGDPMTPLDLAIRFRAIKVIRLLLEAGADPNMRWTDRGDRFPLQEVIEADSYSHGGREWLHRAEAIGLLLRHGADPNARWCPYESRGEWPGGRPRCTTETGTTPLIVAASLGQADVVAQLLAARADTTIQDWQHHTALERAVNAQVYGLILMAPASSAGSETAAVEDFISRHRVPHPRATSVQPILGDALTGQQYGLARLALGAGADPNLVSTRGGHAWMPLASIAGRGWGPGVDLLLAFGADPNSRLCPGESWERGTMRPAPEGCRLETGLTALMLAAQYGQSGVVARLRIRGADVNARDWLGRTAMDHARAAGRSYLFPEPVPVR